MDYREIEEQLAAAQVRECEHERPLDVAPLRRELEAALAGERGVLAALRDQPRAARLALLVGAVSVEALFFSTWLRRDDFATYPALRMGLLVAGYGALAVIAGWHALRPLYLPPAPRWLSRALLVAGLAWPFVVAALPAVPTTTEEHFSHPAAAYYCIVDGGGLAVALLLLARALDRGGHRGVDHALAAVIAAGAAGLLGLQLQCPFNYPLHLALGHAVMPALLLAGTLLFTRVAR